MYHSRGARNRKGEARAAAYIIEIRDRKHLDSCSESSVIGAARDHSRTRRLAPSCASANLKVRVRDQHILPLLRGIDPSGRHRVARVPVGVDPAL